MLQNKLQSAKAVVYDITQNKVAIARTIENFFILINFIIITFNNH